MATVWLGAVVSRMRDVNDRPYTVEFILPSWSVEHDIDFRRSYGFFQLIGRNDHRLAKEALSEPSGREGVKKYGNSRAFGLLNPILSPGPAELGSSIVESTH